MALFNFCLLFTYVSLSISFPLEFECGIPIVQPEMGNIIGGEDAKPYSWPWQVALFKMGLENEEYQFCGGTLISSEWVMTAAHCFYGANLTLGKYTAKLGVYDKTRNDEEGEVIEMISPVHLHPNYKWRENIFDVALVKLSSKVNYTSHILPICLPQQNETLPAPGTRLIVSGWGNTREGGDDSKTLKQVTVPMMDNETCKEDYAGLFVDSVMFCAGYKQGGKDSCQGDSGGPVVHKNKGTGKWTQLGVVSWGLGCAEPDKPGVYSKVMAFVDWIKETIEEE